MHIHAINSNVFNNTYDGIYFSDSRNNMIHNTTISNPRYDFYVETNSKDNIAINTTFSSISVSSDSSLLIKNALKKH